MITSDNSIHTHLYRLLLCASSQGNYHSVDSRIGFQVYAKAVPGSMTEEEFVADLNASTMRLAGHLEEAPESVLGYGDGSRK